MADTGIFCDGDMVGRKAGENASGVAKSEDYTNQYIEEVEAQINLAARFNFSDVYSTLNDDTKMVLQETASNLAAIYVIIYDMSGWTGNRIEAEDMINVLRDAALRNIKMLKDKKGTDFIREKT